ncbi:MAG: cell filamentation protein Fic [Candidatus Omnitrophica bacterium CG11_big_fil_rev_8_21_14_0_20_63_9]|nr:MAG: cell filamentation protein Fic [Candidatus Omnitrophica bacterium CG11_big_fil_rev_8_21_14_0_20_63_9]
MKRSDRYDASGLIEAQFEPGSGGRVLKNLRGIKSRRQMNELETQAYGHAIRELSRLYGRTHQFTAADVCKIHQVWLGHIYAWAGQFRGVNLTKGNFTFAAAPHIRQLMEEFGKGPLTRYTPCGGGSKALTARALAIVHAELVLIHPFRDGNGRGARLLATLMALQAGLSVLDFGGIERGKKRLAYFGAVQAAVGKNYRPMEQVFSDVIDRTLKGRGRSASSLGEGP